jgi:uncharacterized membrane protein YdbT with pleckstrin-like domain
MGYIQESLSEGEEVRALFKLHWSARIPMIAWMILTIVSLGATLFIVLMGWLNWIILAIPVLAITLLLALWDWLKLRSMELGVTNKRVIFKRGIVSRTSEEMRIASIETVEIIQGVMGRIFGYGDVKVTGRGLSDLVFRKISNPMDVKRKIESV